MTRQEIIDTLESLRLFAFCPGGWPPGHEPKDCHAAKDIIQRLKDGEEVESITTSIIWACPLCKHKHEWYWPIAEKPHLNEDIWLVCQGCGKESHMTLTPEGWLWDGDWRNIEKHI